MIVSTVSGISNEAKGFSDGNKSGCVLRTPRNLCTLVSPKLCHGISGKL